MVMGTKNASFGHDIGFLLVEAGVEHCKQFGRLACASGCIKPFSALWDFVEVGIRL